MTIVKLEPCENGTHANQTKVGAFRTIPSGWAAVPPALEANAKVYLPWVTLTMAESEIVGIEENVSGKAAWEAYLASLDNGAEGGEV